MSGVIAWCIVFACILAPPVICQRRRRARRRQPVRIKPDNVDWQLIEALQAQLDATCELGLAYDRQADETQNDIKRAQLMKRAADTYARAAAIQTKIDKLTGGKTK